MLKLVLLIVGLASGALAADQDTFNLRLLRHSLDSACSSPQKSNQIRWPMVVDAVREFNKLDAMKRRQLDLARPTMLLVDFAIIPVINHQDMLGDKDSQEFFAERLVEQYCLFRPAYLEKKFIGNPVKIAKSPKFNRLLQASRGYIAADLTLEDFFAAEREFFGWDLEMTRIRREGDIYADLNALAECWNLANYPAASLLREKIFPTLKQGQSGDLVRELYAQHLRAAGYEVRRRTGAPQARASTLSREELQKTLSAGGTLIKP